MVKIKTKKQFTLPQLEWAWDNPKSSRNKRFVSENKEFPYVNQYVIFNEVGYAEIENSYCYGRNDLFTVEVEEEITEDTFLDYLYVLTDAKDVYRCNNFTIKSTSLVVGQDDLTFFTLIDNNLVKICDKGKLVE